MAPRALPARTTEALHTKYRPQSWDEVVGQDAVVKSLEKVIERGNAKTFLFSGPSGVGKTTLARLAAAYLGCGPSAIMEIDAAAHSGVDHMREVQDAVQYRPFGKSASRAIIVDECHSLSKQAWQSLLKITEKPPEHVFFFFCTTEPAKVPATIKTRCVSYALKPVADKVLGRLYDRVCNKEQIDVEGDIGDMIIREAKGSPRQMLVNLETCRDATTKKEAADLLRAVMETDAVIELARFLMKGGSWVKAMGIVKMLDTQGDAAESVRIVLCNYFAAVARGASADGVAGSALEVLDAFSTPYNGSDGSAQLIMSIGRVLFK